MASYDEEGGGTWPVRAFQYLQGAGPTKYSRRLVYQVTLILETIINSY